MNQQRRDKQLTGRLESCSLAIWLPHASITLACMSKELQARAGSARRVAATDSVRRVDEPGTTKLNSTVTGGMSSFGSASYETQKQFDVPARKNITDTISLRKILDIPEMPPRDRPIITAMYQGCVPVNTTNLCPSGQRFVSSEMSVGCGCAWIRSDSHGCIVQSGCACLGLRGRRGAWRGRGRSRNTCVRL